MAPRFCCSGPTIIDETGGTMLVPPGWTVQMHDSGALIGQTDVLAE